MTRDHSDPPRDTPRRLCVPELCRDMKEICLDSEQTHYLRNVLRLSKGDGLLLFDGSGLEFPAVVSGTSPRGFRLTLSEPHTGVSEPPVRVILGVGLLKSQKMDLVVQKSVELGVEAIVPLTSDRAVRTLDRRREAERRTRWERIAREASRQCGRSRVPAIHPAAALEEFLSGVTPRDLGLLFSTRGAGSMDSTGTGAPHDPERIVALTGPEGGFSPEEEAKAVAAGFVSVRLGPRTLRAETAAILAVGLIQYRFGDLRTLENDRGKG